MNWRGGLGREFVFNNFFWATGDLIFFCGKGLFNILPSWVSRNFCCSPPIIIGSSLKALKFTKNWHPRESGTEVGNGEMATEIKKKMHIFQAERDQLLLTCWQNMLSNFTHLISWYWYFFSTSPAKIKMPWLVKELKKNKKKQKFTDSI